jgi:hypothetical protein
MITTGQFIPGDLPGTPPPDGGASPSSDDGGLRPLTVEAVTYFTTQIPPGAGSQALGGTVTNDAVAVGMRLEGLGTGYWVVPAGSPDPTIANSLGFGTIAGFEPTIPPGIHNIDFVALGPSGQAGLQYLVPFCFEGLIPDNGHVCHPKVKPPAAVFSLHWDSNFDLDLQVTTPSGQILSPKQPYGQDVEAGVRGIDPSIPHIDRDSLRGCVPDGLRQEDAIFNQPLPAGVYTISVDPYAPCGQAAARFTFTMYESSGTCPDCKLVQVGSTVSGEVIASQVTGGVLTPLKIDQVTVP